MLVPLQDNRKLGYDHIEDMKTILSYEDEKPHIVLNHNLLLDKYCKQATKKSRSGQPIRVLDWTRFPKTIETLMLSKSFFKRFTASQLAE